MIGFLEHLGDCRSGNKMISKMYVGFPARQLCQNVQKKTLARKPKPFDRVATCNPSTAGRSHSSGRKQCHGGETSSSRADEKRTLRLQGTPKRKKKKCQRGGNWERERTLGMVSLSTSMVVYEWRVSGFWPMTISRIKDNTYRDRVNMCTVKTYMLWWDR